MKTLFTFFATVFLVTTLHAKIVYLNNNLEAPNISENLFTKWVDAYAAASPGDTIYVVGSNFGYGDITINKKLTLIGPGYFLNENNQTHVDKKTAKFERITIDAGANGTKLAGLSQHNVNKNIIIDAEVDNIIVSNCLLTDVYLENDNGAVLNNITFEKCFIYSSGITYNVNRNGIAENLVLKNNIIDGALKIPNGSTGIIAHNLFLKNTLETGTSSSFEFSDNIYLNQNDNNFSIQPLPNVSVHHNISLTGAFGNENDNFAAPQGTLFVSDDNASTDGQYMLSENSPAKGTGSNGSDIGPFGGPDPYRLSGLPNLPNIYELSTGGFVSGDELPVTIKIKQ